MQLVNFSNWNTEPYSEISQSNPLRWMNLKWIDENTLEPVSHWWKCKDFMNEVVTSFTTKRDFYIYGFSVEHNKFFNEYSKYGLPILLKNTLEGFEHNLLNVINPFLYSQGMPVIPVKDLDKYKIIVIPTEYLENTFFMSQVTLFIRLANTDSVYSSVNELILDKRNSGDKENYNAAMKKQMKDFPDSLRKYLWYYNNEQNLPKDASKDKPIQTSLMHNCGVVSWGWV